METPFVVFANEELNSGLAVAAGDTVHCKECGGTHPLAAGTDASGQPDSILLFYSCGEKAFLGAIAGKLLPGVELAVAF